jgi:uncharacterized protein (DUF1330 family)
MARLVVVAILTVRKAALEDFRAFERRAASVMAAHGGSFERTVTVSEGGPPGTVKEVHVLAFPDRPSFDAYRADPRLAALRHQRERSVVSTEILMGEDGPDYGGG